MYKHNYRSNSLAPICSDAARTVAVRFNSSRKGCMNLRKHLPKTLIGLMSLCLMASIGCHSKPAVEAVLLPVNLPGLEDRSAIPLPKDPTHDYFAVNIDEPFDAAVRRIEPQMRNAGWHVRPHSDGKAVDFYTRSSSSGYRSMDVTVESDLQAEPGVQQFHHSKNCLAFVSLRK